MNEKFFDLPKEKQNAIINGAMHVFAKYEYKKATTEEIAKEAGVSKALLFHYFGNKKELYLFLYDYAIQKSYEQKKELKNKKDNDFFNKIIDAQNCKVKILLEHPDIMMFLTKVYFEENEEVKGVVKEAFKNSAVEAKTDFFKDVDLTKFKDDISPKEVLNIVFWMAEGFMKDKRLEANKTVDLLKLNDEYVKYLKILRKAFYKEEYL
ncbi:MAG: TetR/AcrR family transcriptional regulator [Intestinibacter sp.]|uniref:TetR/AcrR family transcriptional regulator n=1 Tax=Intestinibacter sp. TaxID=1965304 RepID=UPI002A7EEBDF|nr:TetR/AcrR family transcriptional regulator [Intestinibacter sp.]MDY4573667.1 TetR/AcrR family transcriptional regulator [Intestinibacter sp.]